MKEIIPNYSDNTIKILAFLKNEANQCFVANTVFADKPYLHKEYNTYVWNRLCIKYNLLARYIESM
jgi:hypothetical protein